MTGVAVSPYVLLNGLAGAAGLFPVDRRLNERLPHKQNAAYILLISSVVLGWVGAHVLDQIVSGQPFDRAGFVFYGGLLSGLAFLAGIGPIVMVAEELKTTVAAAVVPLLVAQGIGRIGCVLAGCCYGTPMPGTDVLHATPVYESAFVLVLAAWLVRRTAGLGASDAVMYLAAYPAFRFVVEFVRGDARGEALGLSTSQWISIPLALCALCVLAPSAATPARVEGDSRSGDPRTPVDATSR